jgi:hypothetical protein
LIAVLCYVVTDDTKPSIRTVIFNDPTQGTLSIVGQQISLIQHNDLGIGAYTFSILSTTLTYQDSFYTASERRSSPSSGSHLYLVRQRRWVRLCVSGRIWNRRAILQGQLSLMFYLCLLVHRRVNAGSTILICIHCQFLQHFLMLQSLMIDMWVHLSSLVDWIMKQYTIFQPKANTAHFMNFRCPSVSFLVSLCW